MTKRRSQHAEEALALARRLASEEQDLRQREIIAPLVRSALPGGTRIRTRIGGLVYEFRPSLRTLRAFGGWGCFRPRDARTVFLVREAHPYERQTYLEQFPALRLLLLWPDEGRHKLDLWWALPYNEQDALSRFDLPFQPLPVLLCNSDAGSAPPQQFERVVARVDGALLWYDGPDRRADPEHGERLRTVASLNREEETNTPLSGMSSSERHLLVMDRLHKLEMAREGEQQSLARLEGQIRHALHLANATLHSFRELPPDKPGQLGPIVVEWSAAGEQQTQRYHSTVEQSLTVVSSGICLSGRDRTFDLTSLVSVIADAPGYARHAGGSAAEEGDDDDDW